MNELEFPIGISLGDKFKLLRDQEGLSQRQLCEMVDIPQSTLKSLESGRNKTIGVDILAKVVRHPRFIKYAIWLLVDELTDDQAEEALEFVKDLKSSELRDPSGSEAYEQGFREYAPQKPYKNKFKPGTHQYNRYEAGWSQALKKGPSVTGASHFGIDDDEQEETLAELEDRKKKNAKTKAYRQQSKGH